MGDKKLKQIADARSTAESINDNGRKILILTRIKSTWLTEICPFCGSKHQHGKADGHRVVHCIDTEFNSLIGNEAVFENSKGERFAAVDGYFIKTLL